MCNQLLKDKGNSHQAEEETEQYLQYQGEDPDLLEMQEEVKQLARRNEELMAEARAKFATLVAQRAGIERTIPSKRECLEQAGEAAAVLGCQAAKMARQEAKGACKGKARATGTTQEMELG